MNPLKRDLAPLPEGKKKKDPSEKDVKKKKIKIMSK